MQYVQRVSRIGHVARTYGFDVLIAVLAIEAILEVAFRRDDPDAPRTTLWFAIPAVAIIVLPLFARRRFPFAAPAAYWLLGAGLSFVDGRLVPFMLSLFVVGLAASFMLGNLRDSIQARIGLAIVLGSVAIIVYNLPGHTTGELVFIPLQFGIALARRLRGADSRGAGRGRGATGDTGRAGASVGGTRCRGRRARADRTGAPRCRRPRRQRDGASGGRSEAQAPGDPR